MVEKRVRSMDYVIVGGGVYGCGLARGLARRGADVMLLEAETVAGGASGGPGKRGVRANGRDLRELPLMAHAYQLWEKLESEFGSQIGYERPGGLALIEEERDLVRGRIQAEVQSRMGIPSHFLESVEVRELEPEIGPSILGAVYCPLDGVSDHTATTLSLRRAAEDASAIVRERVPVSALEVRGGRVVAVETAFGERIPVQVGLILVANAAVPRLVKENFGLSLPVWSRLPQVLISDPMGTVPVRHLIGHLSRRLALKPLAGGRLMVSGGRLGRWDVRQRRAVASEDEVAANLADARAVFPSLERISVERISVERWESETIDGIPIIDKVPSVENAFFATGWSGHGWAIAPAVIEEMTRWLFTGEMSGALRPFALDRFGERSPID